jgi:integrase
MIKRRATAVGIDGLFAGHSLRSGFATEAYAQGTSELAIMRHGRWKSASVMRGYVQEGTIWSDNAAARLGLLGLLAAFFLSQSGLYRRDDSAIQNLASI